MTIDELSLIFLGTCSGMPTASRFQQSLALRMCGQAWLFDCGEASQHRLAQSDISPLEIRRIFVSHMHGDHIFGLPGMLCGIAGKADNHDDSRRFSAEQPLVIVGPPGLRSWLRVSLHNSYAALKNLKLQVHELAGHKALRRMRPLVNIEVPPHGAEVPGTTIHPEEDGSWVIPSSPTDPPIRVRAVELDHAVPTVGWVLTEEPRPGRLDPSRVVPLLREHGMHISLLKELKTGTEVGLPNGEVIRPEDHMAQSTQRKLVILSDTRKASTAEHVRDATLVVHEATNAWLDEEKHRGLSEREVERTAFHHGHSTPQVAGRYARAMDAQNLVLTHFSGRYGGDSSQYSRRQMGAIRRLAEAHFPGNVICALDLMQVNVSPTGRVTVGRNAAG